MSTITEKPFEYLRRLDSGELFSGDDVRNWYEARAYVTDKLKDVAFGPDDSGRLHAVVTGDTPEMLAVARQVALMAHFINHNEEAENESQRRRSLISIVSLNPEIKSILEREENLCNLTKYCKFKGVDKEPVNEDSYIDIEIEILSAFPKDGTDRENEYIFTEKEKTSVCRQKAENGEDIYSVDTGMAVYTDRIYSIGAAIDNLPAEDIHCASRYRKALDTFHYLKLSDELTTLIKTEKSHDVMYVRSVLSNIFCSDCFESRKKTIELLSKDKKSANIWEKNIERLSKSEHSRWVAEKLIMGYNPITPEQRYRDECLAYDSVKRKAFRDSLKSNPKHPAHIDICSYNTLRRVHPDNMKHDSFLMLAIPHILKKAGK